MVLKLLLSLTALREPPRYEKNRRYLDCLPAEDLPTSPDLYGIT
jgi:hypothetical protein